MCPPCRGQQVIDMRTGVPGRHPSQAPRSLALGPRAGENRARSSLSLSFGSPQLLLQKMGLSLTLLPTWALGTKEILARSLRRMELHLAQDSHLVPPTPRLGSSARWVISYPAAHPGLPSSICQSLCWHPLPNTKFWHSQAECDHS